MVNFVPFVQCLISGIVEWVKQAFIEAVVRKYVKIFPTQICPIFVVRSSATKINRKQLVDECVQDRKLVQNVRQGPTRGEG